MGFVCVGVFLSLVCMGAPGKANVLVSPYRLDKAPKEHVEEVTDSAHCYKIKMGETLDGFNTAEYPGTYDGHMRFESKFEPNEYLAVENIGPADVINPRVVVDGRRNWFSADDILASIFKPGMTDAEKAMAIWKFTARMDVQAHDNNRRVGPPFIDEESHPSRNTFKERANPVKAANCYYCSGCSLSAANFAILCRHAGMVARTVWMCPLDEYATHCVGEVWYDGGWRLFDPELRSFYLQADNATVASYESLHKNPALVARTHDGGFAGKRVKSPAADYKAHYPPHVMPIEQWLSTMDMTLRPGEKFVWRWDHVGKYRCGNNKRNIKKDRPGGILPYQLANGKIIYRPKFTPGLFRRGIVAKCNVNNVRRDGKQWEIRPVAVGKPGSITYKVSSPYPIVGGIVGGKFFRKTDADACRISLSVHNSDWIEVYSAKKTGAIEKYVSIDDALNPKPTPAIYDYYLKFELRATTASADVRLREVYIETDVQMAATSLPSLSVGANLVVYRDESKGNRRVRVTHGWRESSATKPPLPPPEPVTPRDGGRGDVASLKKLVWRDAVDPDRQPVADYHVQVSPRADMLHPISPNFDRIIFSEKPEWSLPEGWIIGGRTYYWRVRAKDRRGAWSDWSAVWKFAVEADSPDYLNVVRTYADAMIEHGRDSYGNVNSPLFAVALDRHSLEIHEGDSLKQVLNIPRADWEIRPNDRMLTGANPMHDQNLYQILYALTKVTGDEHYAAEADGALKWFFENCQSPATGLMAWGEHIGWDFRTEKPIRNTHEFYRPWVLWNRSLELAPQPCRQFALGLWRHQIHDQRTGTFSRHAGYSSHKTASGVEFPRHGGFYIAAWAAAYEKTNDREFLTAIERLTDSFEARRHKQTDALMAETISPGQIWPPSNLSLAVDLWDSAETVPDELAAKMRRCASRTDKVFLTLKHDLSPGGKGFITHALTATLEPGARRKGKVRPNIRCLTHTWSTGYGQYTDAQMALICLLRYNQVKLEGYKSLVLDAAKRYLASEPDESFIVFPGAMADTIFLMLETYRMTGDKKYLARADHFGRMALELFFADDSPLPKASSKHNHYEAVTRADTLIMALLDLWAIKNKPDIDLDMVYNER